MKNTFFHRVPQSPIKGVEVFHYRYKICEGHYIRVEFNDLQRVFIKIYSEFDNPIILRHIDNFHQLQNLLFSLGHDLELIK